MVHTNEPLVSAPRVCGVRFGAYGRRGKIEVTVLNEYHTDETLEAFSFMSVEEVKVGNLMKLRKTRLPVFQILARMGRL